MDDDDGFDLLRGYGVYVHLCTVQIGADRGRAEYMVRAATTVFLDWRTFSQLVCPCLKWRRVRLKCCLAFLTLTFYHRLEKGVMRVGGACLLRIKVRVL